MNKKNKRLSVVIFVLTLCSMLALLAACGGGKSSESSESGESTKSAYQQYIEKYPDYDGTEEEWLKDLLDGKLNDNTPDEKKHTVSFMYDENDEEPWMQETLDDGETAVFPANPKSADTILSRGAIKATNGLSLTRSDKTRCLRLYGKPQSTTLSTI